MSDADIGVPLVPREEYDTSTNIGEKWTCRCCGKTFKSRSDYEGHLR